MKLAENITKNKINFKSGTLLKDLTDIILSDDNISEIQELTENMTLKNMLTVNNNFLDALFEGKTYDEAIKTTKDDKSIFSEWKDYRKDN